MISLEIAKKLKGAGLEWEPQEGDYIFYPDGELTSILTCGDVAFEDLEGCVFAPRLDQLLAEIEKRDWTWMLYAPNSEGKYGIDVGAGLIYHNNQTVMADSPDESAAQALLWILEQEAIA